MLSAKNNQYIFIMSQQLDIYHTIIYEQINRKCSSHNSITNKKCDGTAFINYVNSFGEHKPFCYTCYKNYVGDHITMSFKKDISNN